MPLPFSSGCSASGRLGHRSTTSQNPSPSVSGRGVPTHSPAMHTSSALQRLPSSHSVPSALILSVQLPVAGSHGPPVRHGLGGAQTIASEPVQVPATHVSVCVHRLPSSHGVPSARGLATQSSLFSSQTPRAQAPDATAEQSRARPRQLPSLHVSFTVQKAPSSQAVPFMRGVLTHASIASSHRPWKHWSFAAEQSRGLPRQFPFWQVSPTVQKAPSSQASPSAVLGLGQRPVAASHTPPPAHWSWEQTIGSFPTHSPPRQASVRVQALPSSQAAPSGAFGFEHRPVAGSQMPASWQASMAEHTRG